MARTHLAFAVVATMVIPAGCDPEYGRAPSTDAWRPPAGKADGVAFDEHVWVVDIGPETVVGDTEIAFTNPTFAVAPGDILVGSAGLGLLRRAQTVEQSGDQVLVRTSEATLPELVRDGSFSHTFEPFAQPTEARLDDEPFRASFDVDGGYVKFGNTRLLTDGGMQVELTSGHVDFQPSLMLDFSIQGGEIERFELEASGSFDAEIGLRFSSTGEHGVSHKFAKLVETPKFVWTGAIGPVPIVVATWLEVGAEVAANTAGTTEVEMVAGASSWVRLGTSYQAPQWYRSSDEAFVYDYAVPMVVFEGPAAAKIGLDAKLKVAFYGVAGPWLSIKPAVRARLESDGGQLKWFGDVGVAAKFGGAVYLPGNREIGVEGTFWDWYHTFASGVVGGGSPGGGTPTDPGQSICGGQQPFASDLVCNGAGIRQNVASVEACIRNGGGASCLTAAEFGPTPLCGSGSGGGYRCDANGLFECLCYDGGSTCVAEHCATL